ncbi:hypothetical protein CRUP_027086 [Coryphaenoides rupestris]|nr:hypothetical protein CRUP_027086 [Coryphaenoides rupestris]
MNMDPQSEHLPGYFNALEKWPGKIHEPLDQGNCAASWAFSTASVASDRIAIQSMGHMTPQLSPQNLISCDTRNQAGCAGGHIDGAWWFLRRRGVVTEDCYPSPAPQQTPAEVGRCMMQSRSVGRGKRQATQRCPNSRYYHNDIYQSTPPYRLSANSPNLCARRSRRSLDAVTHDLMNMDPQSEHLPGYFNALEKWPGKIHEPLDQGNCAASWAFSTAFHGSHDAGSSRPQNLISCDTRNQAGCAGGHIDGAWWFLRRRGVVTEDCYPSPAPQQTPAEVGRCMMQSRSVGRGKRQATQRCPNSRYYHNDIYQSTPPYRLSANDKEIMKEIMDNGPVQAIMEVHEDFFVYKSGIYKHTDVSFTKPPQSRKHGTHSVRIIG